MKRTYESPVLTGSADVIKVTNASSSGSEEAPQKSLPAGSVGFAL